MKKEIVTCFTLLILFLGAAYNIMHLKHLTEYMNNHLTIAEQAYTTQNYTDAEAELYAALQLWLSADDYTHIFIRHSEIDAATDAYYESLSAIQEKAPSALTAIQKVEYHINSIYSMELLTLKSVF